MSDFKKPAAYYPLATIYCLLGFITIASALLTVFSLYITLVGLYACTQGGNWDMWVGSVLVTLTCVVVGAASLLLALPLGKRIASIEKSRKEWEAKEEAKNDAEFREWYAKSDY